MPKLPELEIKGRVPDDPAISLALGDFAGVVNGCSFGRIYRIKPNFDHHGDLYYLRLYDTDTGYPFICPDNRCCNSQKATNLFQAWPPDPKSAGCVICTTTGGRSRFSRYTEDDIAFFRAEGMIRGN